MAGTHLGKWLTSENSAHQKRHRAASNRANLRGFSPRRSLPRGPESYLPDRGAFARVREIMLGSSKSGIGRPKGLNEGVV